MSRRKPGADTGRTCLSLGIESPGLLLGMVPGMPANRRTRRSLSPPAGSLSPQRSGHLSSSLTGINSGSSVAVGLSSRSAGASLPRPPGSSVAPKLLPRPNRAAATRRNIFGSMPAASNQRLRPIASAFPVSLASMFNVARETMERSSIRREKSQKRREITSMSAADDVMEMKSLSNDLADRIAGTKAKLAARAGVVMKAIGGITENRALEFLSGKARRVDGWEKDNARQRIAELDDLERIERENAHLAWLECEIARHRVSGTEFRGAHVDALEHVLRVARGDAGAVEVSEAEPADFSD